MSSEISIGEKVQGAQAVEQDAVDEEPELRATVDLEVQAKVDTNHPDARPEGMTLAAEEKFRAREQEIRRTRDRRGRTEHRREEQARVVAARGCDQRRRAFEARAASVDKWQAPDASDPREQLSREALAAVNQEAARIVERVDGWTRAAVNRRLAERVANGADVASAVVATVEALETAPGTVVPIGKLEAISRQEVSIDGRITQLWESDSPAIQQVGLIEDASGTTKLTSWVASDQPRIEEGERVRILGAAKNWYNGRVSVALTRRSTVQFPERGRRGNH